MCVCTYTVYRYIAYGCIWLLALLSLEGNHRIGSCDVIISNCIVHEFIALASPPETDEIIHHLPE